MTAVAGDFYEFIRVDQNRAGFLVAEVAGHGVPAALIASMLKVAIHMAAACANDPGAVLRGLNRVLSGLLRGQLVSAAYLGLDMENRLACMPPPDIRPSCAGGMMSWNRSKATDCSLA
jgi:serine phosphatase RsbU (regulator of sigma subunit)